MNKKNKNPINGNSKIPKNPKKSQKNPKKIPKNPKKIPKNPKKSQKCIKKTVLYENIRRMTIYKCEVCDYHTTHKSAFKKHCDTNKHHKNVKINNSSTVKQNSSTVKHNSSTVKQNSSTVNSIKKYKCKYCEIIYSRSDSYNRHLITCSKLFSDKMGNLRNKLDKSEEENNQLQEENNQLQEEVNQYQLESELYKKETGKIREQYIKLVKKTMNATNEISKLKEQIHKLEHDVKDTEIKYLKKERNIIKNSNNITQYITNKYPNAPNLNPIDKLDNYEKYVYGCEDNKADHNKAIANLINNHYCKDIPPEKRSIWCVDSSRDKFILRENDTWNTDIHGNTFCKKVINPLGKLYTEYTNKLINDGVQGISERIMGLMYFNMYVMGLNKLPKTVLPYLIADPNKKLI